MTTIDQFKARCKTRPDFADQIQVRYFHSNDETYDTWVSGEEVILRLASAEAEEKLRERSQTDLGQLKRLIASLPERTKQHLRFKLVDHLTKAADVFVGDDIIGSSLVKGITGDAEEIDPADYDLKTWSALLQNPIFRDQVLELAWIQLESSYPDDESLPEPDDWI